MTAALREQFEGAEKANLTPLIDVAFLILIFFMCLPFRNLDGKLAPFLPRESGWEVGERPPEAFRIQVHIVGRDEQSRAWGPKNRRLSVTAPTRVLYRFADGRTTDDLDVVGAHIRRMQRAAETLRGATVRGKIKAGRRIPHKFVIAVLNRFAEERLLDVDFEGTSHPTRAMLTAPTLPYPSESYVGRR